MALETHSNDVAPTLRTITNWILICEPNMEKEPKIISRPHGYFKGSESEISPTVKASAFADNNFLKMPIIGAFRGRSDGEWHESEHEQRLETRDDGVTNTITGVNKDNVVVEKEVLNANEQGFRIRKLTEREAFRLMDVDDADIDKIQAAGISKTQQIKMAGNSICVNVLTQIFRKMFVDTERESAQLELF